MESYYLLIVGVLFVLAISDLIVGVSNDAVNFLNSAIGSKAAPFAVILTIAALGVLLGAIFSNGMMEVARKGVFFPDQFTFAEIMVVFLAVMMTDILLLDFFNTVGLPTSTTVSIVFELLGASVALATIKIFSENSLHDSLASFINMDSAILIITGIFLSVLIAFTVGLIIQAIVRFAFSFNLERSYRFWGGIWGGFSLTAILYFLLIKGAKGSTLVSGDQIQFLKDHTFLILLISFVLLTAVLQLLVMFTRINVLKFTVLAGTFALAMAFAGNDLVNFIGVPLAGFESFKAWSAAGASPDGLMMTALTEPVQTPLLFLIGAGLIMVITLKLSKKAKSVTATTIDLSRQDEGSERFKSFGFARVMVRTTHRMRVAVDHITPKSIRGYSKQRFDNSNGSAADQEGKVAFDLVRASVNLVVASILISIGTSLKLPLSTTYVTFMVAMGTSLADGAWGRESAVYRISGVLTVIAGWFFTAATAFSAAFIIATIIYFGKLPVILALIGATIFILIRTQRLHKKRAKKALEAEKMRISQTMEVLNSSESTVKSYVLQMSKLLLLALNGFSNEKLKDVKKVRKQSKKLSKRVEELKEEVPTVLKKLEENEIESGHYYVQVLDSLEACSDSLKKIVKPAYKHLDNTHLIEEEQAKSVLSFNEKINEFFNYSISLLQNRNAENLEEYRKKQAELTKQTDKLIKHYIKSLKKGNKKTKANMTLIAIFTESKNLIEDLGNLVEADMGLVESTDIQLPE